MLALIILKFDFFKYRIEFLHCATCLIVAAKRGG